MKKSPPPARHTSITLGPHFEKFIARQVTKGRFGTTSEVIRAGLRLLEAEESKLAALRRALDEGEQSGFDARYSLERLLGELDRQPS